MNKKELLMKSLLEDNFNSKVIELATAANGQTNFDNAEQYAQSAINDNPNVTVIQLLSEIAVQQIFSSLGYIPA